MCSVRIEKWRSPFLPQENFSKSTQRDGRLSPARNRLMIYDFAVNCKAYDKNKYTKEYFPGVSCPKCHAIGRFNMHGDYSRHVIYFSGGGFVHTRLEIKRVKCKSCKSTHAVMPRDIIPYRLLALTAALYILFDRFLTLTPVLRIAGAFSFSHQFVYSALYTFDRFRERLTFFFKELDPARPPAVTDRDLLSRINGMGPACRFQFRYMKSNRRPCFMCKFFDALAPPYISIVSFQRPPGGPAT